MPCICHGSVSGDEEFDKFLRSQDGGYVIEYLRNAALIIKSHNISLECDLNQIEFRQMFVKAFLHMLVGCDEMGRPKANG